VNIELWVGEEGSCKSKETRCIQAIKILANYYKTLAKAAGMDFKL
jgi:hypothetical protein